MSPDQGIAGAVLFGHVAADAAIAEKCALRGMARAPADLEPAGGAVGVAVDVGQLAERSPGIERRTIDLQPLGLRLPGQIRPRRADERRGRAPKNRSASGERWQNRPPTSVSQIQSAAI